MSREDVNNLVYTSIDDMKGSLECAESGGAPYTVEVLKIALALALKTKQKTKANILKARISRYEKAVNQ
jgi:hypothetical protein